MRRRSFLKVLLVGAAGTLVLPQTLKVEAAAGTLVSRTTKVQAAAGPVCGNQKIPVPTHPTKLLTYGARIPEVSYGWVWIPTYADIDRRLNQLRSLGVKVYNIGINYDYFFENYSGLIAKIDYVVNMIRSFGGQLHLTDCAAESWRKKRLTWTEWMEHFRNRAKLYIERYRPDHYTVLHEPNGWMQDFLLEPATPQMWADCGNEITALVKSIDGSVKTSHAFIASPWPSSLWPNELETIKLVGTEPSLDIVGFDLYGSKCGIDDKSYLASQALPYVTGKSIAVPETWGSTKEYIATGYDTAEVEQNWGVKVSELAYKLATERGYNVSFINWYYTIRLNDPKIFNYIKEIVDEYQA